jgi:CRISPR/Cas system Type II protein with McrA/HNH and RuvC-like nuclease domain
MILRSTSTSVQKIPNLEFRKLTNALEVNAMAKGPEKKASKKIMRISVARDSIFMPPNQF